MTNFAGRERLIRPQTGLVAVDLAELWRYRELFVFLAWRDILVRYKQTVVGIAWTLVRPVATAIVFTVIFGKLAKFPSDGIPYPLLCMTALVPWQFFANSLTESSNSLIVNGNMISKIYFPRLIVPASAVMSGLVDVLLSFGVLAGLMCYCKIAPGWHGLFLPAFVGLAICCAFGAGLWLSALNVAYRDVRHIVPFVVQFGLYVSPVGFSSSIVPGRWRLLYSLNPMTGVIDGFRWALLGGDTRISAQGLGLSAAVAVTLLVSGAYYFRQVEGAFVDII